MTTQTLDANTLPQPQPGAPPLPFIDPANCVIQYAGQAFKEVFVRLPKELIADDLKIPELWRKLQAKPGKALRKFDRVIAVSFDESWLAEAVVADARGEIVVLAKP